MGRFKKLKVFHDNVESWKEETSPKDGPDEENIEIEEMMDMSKKMWVEVTAEDIVDLQLNGDRLDSAPLNSLRPGRALRGSYAVYKHGGPNSSLENSLKDLSPGWNSCVDSEIEIQEDSSDAAEIVDRESVLSSEDANDCSNSTSWNCHEVLLMGEHLDIWSENSQWVKLTGVSAEKDDFYEKGNCTGVKWDNSTTPLIFPQLLNEEMNDNCKNERKSAAYPVSVGLEENLATAHRKPIQPLKITECYSEEQKVTDCVIGQTVIYGLNDGKIEQKTVNLVVKSSLLSGQTAAKRPIQSLDALQHQCPKEEKWENSTPQLSLPLLNQTENVIYLPENLKLEQNPITVYQCVICGDIVTTKEYLAKHLRDAHVSSPACSGIDLKENRVTTHRKLSQSQSLMFTEYCSDGQALRLPETTDCITCTSKTVAYDLDENRGEQDVIPAKSSHQKVQSLIQNLVVDTVQPRLPTCPKTLVNQLVNQSLVPLEQAGKAKEANGVRKKLIVKLHSKCTLYENVQYQCPYCNVSCLLKHLATHLEEMHSTDLSESLGINNRSVIKAFSSSTINKVQHLNTTLGVKDTSVNALDGQQEINESNSENGQNELNLPPKQVTSDQTEKIQENFTNAYQTKNFAAMSTTTVNNPIITYDKSDHDELPVIRRTCICSMCGFEIVLSKAQIFGFTVLRQTVQCKCPACNSWSDLLAEDTVKTDRPVRNRRGSKIPA